MRYGGPDAAPSPTRPAGARVNAPHLVALVRAGARFESGRIVE